MKPLRRWFIFKRFACAAGASYLFGRLAARWHPYPTKEFM